MDNSQRLIEEIKRLERELREELQKKQAEFFYQIKGKRVQFEERIRRYHKSLATSSLLYVLRARLLHVLTAPVIWTCLLPALAMDLVVSLYQAICFPVYGIPRVMRGDYIVLDRHRLGYLNAIQKLNCLYCGYFGGVIAYTQEVAARTEQYWCPIKHARRQHSLHSRYHKFLEYGDAEQVPVRWAELRKDFGDLKDQNDKKS